MSLSPIQITTRTVAGIQLQAAQYFRVPMVFKPHTTLNEALNILQDFEAFDIQQMNVNLFVIGNKGLAPSVNTNGDIRMVPQNFKPTNAGLYNQLPFVLRLPTNDLSAGERTKYRLRRLEVHGGQTYVAYYGKVIDKSDAISTAELRHVEGDTITSVPYVPSISELHPTPQPLTTGNAVISTGDYVAASVKIPFTLTQAELNEFREACNIIYGDEGYANITEVGFASSQDVVTQGDFNGVQVAYTEAAGVLLTNWATAGIMTDFVNQQVNIMFDVGANEPMPPV